MKKPLAAAHKECAGAHNEGQRRLLHYSRSEYKNYVSKIPFIDSLTLVMKNALSRIVKNACGVMKKPQAAAHEECAIAHNEEAPASGS